MTNDANDSKPPPPYNADKMSDTKKEPATGSKPEPRYLYYRVYSPDGAIPSKTAFDPRNPFIGRIAARSVPPPHNATSLKRCFVKAENITDPDGSRTLLYQSPDASYSLQSTDKVAIVGPIDGATPETAFALVLQDELTQGENAAINCLDLSSRCEENPKYLYYRLFTQTAEDCSKVAFNLDDPALGRVERILVSPPHESASLKRHIAKVESKPIYAFSALFKNISALEALQDFSDLPLMKNGSPGWTEDEPMVLVQPERRAGLYNRPIKVLSNSHIRRSNAPAVGAVGSSDGVCISGRRISNSRVYSCQFPTGFEYFPADYIKFLDE
ncbi:hypothetical protein K438DRAFT_1869167 [Mycena galopus ATCC 62051]|nr:hypothetical protein K438DRAFT_1869167 [Mycena galopus ATCC 62051]